MFGQERKPERAEVLTLVNHSDGAHQRAKNKFNMILEIVDLDNPIGELAQQSDECPLLKIYT